MAAGRQHSPESIEGTQWLKIEDDKTPIKITTFLNRTAADRHGAGACQACTRPIPRQPPGWARATAPFTGGEGWVQRGSRLPQILQQASSKGGIQARTALPKAQALDHSSVRQPDVRIHTQGHEASGRKAGQENQGHTTVYQGTGRTA